MTLTIYEKVNQLTTNLIEDVEPGTLQKFRSSKQDRKDGTPMIIVEKLPFYNSLPYDLRQVISPDHLDKNYATSSVRQVIPPDKSGSAAPRRAAALHPVVIDR